MTDYTPDGFFPPGYFPPDYFGGDAGGVIVGVLVGAAAGSCVVTGALTNGAQSATPYPTKERRRKKVWTVRTPWGRREEYDTAQAAYARYAELFEGAKPKAAKGKAKAKPRTAPVIAPAVEYEGVDLGAAFARLARDYGAAIGAQVANQIAAQLAAIEARARREAEERDDEEAILLLLH